MAFVINSCSGSTHFGLTNTSAWGLTKHLHLLRLFIRVSKRYSVLKPLIFPVYTYVRSFTCIWPNGCNFKPLSLYNEDLMIWESDSPDTLRKNVISMENYMILNNLPINNIRCTQTIFGGGLDFTSWSFFSRRIAGVEGYPVCLSYNITLAVKKAFSVLHVI